MSTQEKAQTTLNGPTTTSTEKGANVVSTHLHRDPVVEALRILARRGQQVLEAEAEAARVAEGGAG